MSFGSRSPSETFFVVAVVVMSIGASAASFFSLFLSLCVCVFLFPSQPCLFSLRRERSRDGRVDRRPIDRCRSRSLVGEQLPRVGVLLQLSSVDILLSVCLSVSRSRGSPELSKVATADEKSSDAIAISFCSPCSHLSLLVRLCVRACACCIVCARARVSLLNMVKRWFRKGSRALAE